MKKTIIAANWKSNKTKSEAKNWLEQVAIADLPMNLEIIILPSFTLLDYVSSYIKVNGLPFRIGAQDISPFESGAYTGEISSSQIKEFADYVLIGHSERRTNFSEDKEMINKKIEKATTGELIPIVCISDLSQIDNFSSNKGIIIAYEPKGAISTSGPNAKAESPDLVSEFVKKIKERLSLEVIYGGSVDVSNVRQYLNLEDISGALVGGQSLEPKNFINLLKKC